MKVITKQLIVLFAYLFLSTTMYAQTPNSMKLNAGIITEHMEESKQFYTEILNFGIVFENEFYLLLHTPNHAAELSFLKPNHPSQQPLFHAPFSGKGMYLTLEVDDVDAMYQKLKTLQIPIIIDIRNEPWGDRHFAIQDPNGVGIDIVTYHKVD